MTALFLCRVRKSWEHFSSILRSQTSSETILSSSPVSIDDGGVIFRLSAVSCYGESETNKDLPFLSQLRVRMREKKEGIGVRRRGRRAIERGRENEGKMKGGKKRRGKGFG